jgi:hypothetical protein
MSAENYAFSMRLVEDSIQTACGALSEYRERPAHDLNRIRNLLQARAWVSCAKTNLAFAERDLAEDARTLKPLRARRAAKGPRS